MSTVQPTDKVLVNRAGTDYSATADTLMATIQDTDLLLVNRAGVDYKCSGLDFKASMKPPETVDKPSFTSPSDGATDVGKNPTFTSSAFSGTGGTHVSSDWQVTTKADTGFAAIVTQSMADTTNLVSWDSGDLAADTDYIARVRYHSAGAVSPWSDVVGFKTKAFFGPVIANKPGALYHLTDRAAGLTRPNQPPVLIVNFVNASYNNPDKAGFAVGVDGHVYKADLSQPSLSWSQFSAGWGGKVVSFSTIYNNTDDTYIALDSDGVVHKGSGVSALPAAATGKVQSLLAVGSGVNYLGVVTTDGAIYVNSLVNSAVKFGSVSFTSQNSWVDAGITLPAGEKPIKVSGIPDTSGPNYSAANIAILSDAGKVYTVVTGNNGTGLGANGPVNGGSNASPNLWLTGVADINPIDRSDIRGGFTALMNDGRLFYGISSYRGTAFPQNRPWGPFDASTDWATTIYSMPQGNAFWVAVKKDGLIYINDSADGTSFSKLNYGAAPENPISTFGSLPGCQQDAGKKLDLIIPN